MAACPECSEQNAPSTTCPDCGSDDLRPSEVKDAPHQCNVCDCTFRAGDPDRDTVAAAASRIRARTYKTPRHSSTRPTFRMGLRGRAVVATPISPFI